MHKYTENTIFVSTQKSSLTYWDCACNVVHSYDPFLLRLPHSTLFQREDACQNISYNIFPLFWKCDAKILLG